MKIMYVAFDGKQFEIEEEAQLYKDSCMLSENAIRGFDECMNEISYGSPVSQKKL